jgi:hypothetical protein
MAAVAMAHSNMAPPRDEHTMDTRTPSPRPPPHSSNSSNDVADYQPDLSQEVSLLSTKLINAINYQTNLDDSLQHTRHELEAANRENARLRAEKKSLDDMVANGLLVRKSVVDQTVGKLRAELAKERAAREEAEKARKQTDAELESLTTALFEEANTMVAAARKDTEAVEKRNSQLRGQISDTELLLASQQEQLQDLKLTMGRMSERGDNDTSAGRDSIPSTPIGSSAAMFDAMQLSPNASHIADVPPEHPLYFSQLLTPVLRSDIPAYLDFQDLLQSARKAMGHSRGPSGNNSSGGLSSSSQTNLAISSPSLPGAFSFSTNSSPQSTSYASTAPPLKDSKFYKRSLVEDIEPTLRLDLAPGLSFLSRRTVLSSLLQGSMVVEPFMPQTKFYGPIFSCALCGESRKAEPYVRKHRFRTSEEESAQRYPLCDYCLGRTRAAGDFVGFLRMVRDGHWRAENEEEQKGAWEEAVRLRERMFWARQGGGVIPNLIKQGSPSTAHMRSARQSLESIPEQESSAKRASLAMQEAQKVSLDQMVDGELQPREAGSRPEPDEKLLGLFKSHRQSMSIGGNLADASAVPGKVTEAPEVMEPREMEPVPITDSQEVVDEPVTIAAEPTVEIAEPEVGMKEPVAVVAEQVTTTSQPEALSEESTVAADDATIAISQPEAASDDTVVAADQSSIPTSQPEAVLEDSTVAVDEPTIAAPEPEITETPSSNEDVPPATPEVAPAVLESEKSDAPDAAIPEPTPIVQTDDAATPAVASPDVPIVEESGPSTESAVVEAPTDIDSTLQAPARPSQRKNSSVLDRVRAMETTPKPPGSFD